MNRSQLIQAGINAGIFSPSATYGDSIINNSGETAASGTMEISIIASQNEADGIWEEIFVNEIASDLVFIIGGHVNPFGGCNIYDLEITAEINTSIQTQNQAQNMLDRISLGITNKDTIRAHLGAIQNRLENTISNLQIQAENLQTSESRISDADVATEMTEFMRNQILTQSATAMLAQANSLPQMVLQLIQSSA